MIGFLIGTACLIGLIKTLRRGPYGYGGGCGPAFGPGCHGGHHGGGRGWGGPYRGHGGPWGGRGWEGGRGDDARGASPESFRWMLRGLFERLQTSPGQERVIIEAAETLQSQVREVKQAAQSTGTETAKAFRGERFDEAAMGEAFAKQDAALESVQKAYIEALMKVHEALDERQRRELSDLMERGTGFFGRWGGRGVYRF